MFLDQLAVENFRGLTSISFSTDKLLNVIVGPNAVGKTTILEAIRLAKGALSPRFGGETNNVFQSLGLLSPNHRFLALWDWTFAP